MYKIIFSLLMVSFSLLGTAQNVGIGTNTPQAALDVTSTSNGFLPPRLTLAQRDAIQNPVEGVMIFNTTRKCTEVYIAGAWQPMYCYQPAPVTDINGNVYPTVQICDQTWTAKNLNVSTYTDGTVIPEVQNAAAWAALTTGAWCYYANSPDSGAKYGKLYNWYAVAGIYDAASLNNPLLRKKLSPTGWHLPSDAEWNILTKCIDPSADTTQCCSNVAGTAMKSTSGWYNGGNGTNSSGFAGLPGGNRNNLGTFLNIGANGIWWSSAENGTTYAWGRSLYYYLSYVGRDYYYKSDGFSVRCLRD